MTEELIQDRIRLRKFLDIKDENTIPDETTMCKFRYKLIKEELLGLVFNEVKNDGI
jgi:IS5 family transposase